MNESWEWFLNSQLINVILKVKENNTRRENVILIYEPNWKFIEKSMELKIADFNKVMK